MTERMTIQQYRTSKGLPSFGLGLDDSLLSPNGRLSKRLKDLQTTKMQETSRALGRVDAEYIEAIKSGAIVDPSGTYSIASLLLAYREKAEQEISSLQSSIDTYRRMGQGKRGIKPTYQKVIDEYEAKIAEIRQKLVDKSSCIG